MEREVTDLVRRLPPMPRSVEELLAAAAGKDQSDQQLLEIVRHDPGLCADLLHLANTFCDTGEGTVDTIEEAVEFVGVRPMAQLIGVWYARNVILEQFAKLEHLDEYFNHSHEISLSCRILAETAEMDKHQCQAYSVAGLIHDVGRLIIMLAGGKNTAHLMGTPCSLMQSIIKDERESFAMDHCEIGMRICRRWNFSGFLQEGLLRHHSPLIGDDFSQPGAVIFIAHFVSSSDFTGELLTAMLPAEVIGGIGITLESFDRARFEYLRRTSEHN